MRVQEVNGRRALLNQASLAIINPSFSQPTIREPGKKETKSDCQAGFGFF
jgi:hypothetical protein